jgi:hypothetical protein
MVRLTGWRAALLATGVLTGMGLAGCGLYPDPPSVVVPPDAPQVIGTQIVGAVVDAKTSALVTQPVTLKFVTESGAPATFVQDTAGKSVSSLQVSNGLVSLAITDGTSFPVNLIVTATADGFVPTSATVPLTGPGQYKLLEELTSNASPPEGVAVSEDLSAGSTDSSGTTVASATVATDSASLTLPAATTVTDASGSPLTGALTASVANYDPASPAAMKAVPGDLAHATIKSSGTASQAALVLAGFSQIFIQDSTGKQAASFSQPLPAVLQIADTTVNPLTGATLMPGDSVPVFSYDEKTGAWTSEGDATLSTSAVAGKLDASFSVSHLSGWAVGYPIFQAQWCDITLNVSGAGSTTISLVASATGFSADYTVRAGETSISLDGLPPALTATVNAYVSGHKVGSVAVNQCTPSGTLTVTLPSPATLDVNVFNVCQNDASRKTPVPSSQVTATVTGAAPVSGTTDTTGLAHLTGFLAGDNVAVYAEQRGTSPSTFVQKTATLAAGANTLEFDFPVPCTVLTGASGGTP